MSWLKNLASPENTSALTSFVKQAVSSVESQLDKVLDIPPEKSEKAGNDDDFFAVMFGGPVKQTEKPHTTAKPLEKPNEINSSLSGKLDAIAKKNTIPIKAQVKQDSSSATNSLDKSTLKNGAAINSNTFETDNVETHNSNFIKPSHFIEQVQGPQSTSTQANETNLVSKVEKQGDASGWGDIEEIDDLIPADSLQETCGFESSPIMSDKTPEKEQNDLLVSDATDIVVGANGSLDATEIVVGPKGSLDATEIVVGPKGSLDATADYEDILKPDTAGEQVQLNKVPGAHVTSLETTPTLDANSPQKNENIQVDNETILKENIKENENLKESMKKTIPQQENKETLEKLEQETILTEKSLEDKESIFKKNLEDKDSVFKKKTPEDKEANPKKNNLDEKETNPKKEANQPSVQNSHEKHSTPVLVHVTANEVAQGQKLLQENQLLVEKVALLNKTIEKLKQQINQASNSDSLTKKLLEKEESIRGLLSEGEALAKDVLKANNNVKRLRAKETELKQEIEANKSLLLQRTQELESYRQKVSVLEEKERSLQSSLYLCRSRVFLSN